MSIALIALTLGSFSGFARTQESGGDCSRKEKTEKVRTIKADRNMRQSNLGSNPFEGIELTGDQQAQLNLLRQSRMKERLANRQNRTALADSVMGRTANRREYLREVKEIIGPDQYTLFLENIVVNGNNSGRSMRQGSRKIKAQNVSRTERGNGEMKVSRTGYRIGE